MRKIFNYVTFAVLAGFAVLTIIQCSKPAEKEEEEQVEWKEMDDYHAVMADVFHPLKDSGNLEPIKTRAEELAASASKWADAELPKKVDNEEMKGRLAQLKDASRGLADQVNAGAGDEIITTQLTELHDLFHAIQEGWYGGGEEHHH
jgi:hypothetical protein